MANDALQPAAIRALVEADRVHRDLYLDPNLFSLERERLFARTWSFVGHASEVPASGDYVTRELHGRPLVMVRDAEGVVNVLYNRCAHKGTRLVTEEAGNTGKFFRCPYHAWTYKLGGAPLAMPLKDGYEKTGLRTCESGAGMRPVAGVANHREFIFVRLSEDGIGFESYFGEALKAIDNMVDRSPEGRLTVAGGVLRNVIDCNWKIYLENINDAVHPISTHESASQTAKALWQGHAASEPKPMAIEQILPFAESYSFFDEMGARVFPNGHSLLGIAFSIHSSYSRLPEYESALQAAHGAERAAEVLGRSPQNALFYPGLIVKGSPQAIRVIRPLAVDRTLVESWSFRAEGAPPVLFDRSMSYNRLVFSPMSIVAHDDVALFESIQLGLQAEGNDWISLHRDFDASEFDQPTLDTNGANELPMRNQHRAWVRFMADAS